MRTQGSLSAFAPGDRCEYCLLRQEHVKFSHHIEHIVAKQHGGDDSPENLALSCARCNSYKEANLSGIDPDTNAVVRLFNPRRQKWKRHFRWDGPRLEGRTRISRATVVVLQINHPDALDARHCLIAEGVFPPG